MSEAQEKIVFDLPYETIAKTEAMFADVLGDGQYRLDNIPIFMPFISIDDVFVIKHVSEDSDRKHFDKIVQRSDNVTHRLWILELDRPDDELDRQRYSAIDALKALVNGVESYQNVVFALNVSARLSQIKKDVISKLLIEGQRNNWWQWDISSSPRFPLEKIQEFYGENPDLTW